MEATLSRLRKYPNSCLHNTWRNIKTSVSMVGSLSKFEILTFKIRIRNTNLKGHTFQSHFLLYLFELLTPDIFPIYGTLTVLCINKSNINAIANLSSERAQLFSMTFIVKIYYLPKGHQDTSL
jgi:hypothetical protein